MSFEGKIVTDDDNVPLTDSGELILPPDISELGERLKVESVQLAVDYPAAPRGLGSPDMTRRRSPSLVWRAASGIAAACLVFACVIAWYNSQTGQGEDSDISPAQGSHLAGAAGSLHETTEMAAGSTAQRARYLSPAVQATPMPPLEDDVTHAELLDRIDLLERAVEGYQFAVERLHEQVQQGDHHIEELQQQIENTEAAR